MNTPNPIPAAVRPTRTKAKHRSRWLLLAALSASGAAAGIWSATQGRASPSAEPAAAGHSAHGATSATDARPGQHVPGKAAGDGSVQLSPEMARSLRIAVVEAELAPVGRTIRTTGHVAYDESRLTTVAPRFAGFVERLHVDFTGQAVRKGQPLLEVYSPELVAAQEELLAAARMADRLRQGGAPSAIERSAALLEAARRRLLLWDISPAQVQQIESTGEVRHSLTLHAPFGGFVVEKPVQAGQAVEMGMPLYRLADLSRVWIEADVYEQDLRFVRLGEAVRVEIAAYPGEWFQGRVSYLYPEVRLETRTATLRVELANPGGRIKPGMFATVKIDAPVRGRAVLVPRDAVMHSGTHAMVFVEEAEGVYRAREVQIGAELGGRTEILAGLVAGERVVARANFLLDSESRLTESLGAMPGMNH